MYSGVESQKLKGPRASSTKKGPKIGPDDFDILCLVGEGAFGKVYQVTKKSTNEVYAMKVRNEAGHGAVLGRGAEPEQ